MELATSGTAPAGAGPVASEMLAITVAARLTVRVPSAPLTMARLPFVQEFALAPAPARASVGVVLGAAACRAPGPLYAAALPSRL